MASATPLLRTKLTSPNTPPNLVQRDRLIALLQVHPERACTLISAPAGYGKSTLASSWLHASGLSAAWLSLDEHDDELRRFLRYLVAAVRTRVEDACYETERILQVAELPAASVLAGYLSNDLEELQEPLVLVVDDYHRIHGRAIHEVVGHLIQRPPRPLHLVLITRHDPPLAGLRAHSGVVEIREEDLRFSLDETRRALRSMAGVEVSDDTLTGLHAELEGWVVGLRLVCLALRHKADPDAYLGDLRGGSRDIQQYLLDEVLRQQPRAFQHALCSVSVLDRFCAPLCEAVSRWSPDGGRDEDLDEDPVQGEAFIEGVERDNMFAIRLDERGEWLRFHHQFQQLLRWQLGRQATPDEISALHGRASAWFESEELLDEAIEHAVRAGDIERAARLIEENRVELLNDDKWYVLERWIEMLPESIRQQRPGLLMAEAWSAYEHFQFDRLAATLEVVRPLLTGEESESALGGEYLLLRGELHYWSGEGAAARRLFDDARALLPERHGLVRGLLELQHGLALCMEGEREQAIHQLGELVQEAGAPEGIYISRLIAGLNFVHHLSGNLLLARGEAQRLRVVAKRSDIAYTDAWSSYMEACSHFHAGEYERARVHFVEAVRQRYILHRRAAVDAMAGLALTHQLDGREDAATEAMEALHAFALELSDTQYLSVARSCRARLALLRGDLDTALEWARSAEEFSVSSALFTWLEVPVITQARALLAGGSVTNVDRALDLLAQVRRHAEEYCFVNQAIEVGVLQALAQDRRGRHPAAREHMLDVIDLAEPGGWFRPFVEAGAPLAALVSQLPVELRDRHLVAHVWLAIGQREDASRPILAPPGPPVEPLTNRELDVLELLALRLYDKEIARELSISVGTVKSHLKHLYAKFAVSGRRQAVAKAEKLGLLKR